MTLRNAVPSGPRFCRGTTSDQAWGWAHGDLLAQACAGTAAWRPLSPHGRGGRQPEPAEDWYRSAWRTIFELDNAHESSPFLDLWRNWLGDRFDEPAAMIDAYERHNAAVRSAVPPERLLEWAVGDGWAPLCDRLGVPIPDQPFPWTNTTEQFRTDNLLDTEPA